MKKFIISFLIISFLFSVLPLPILAEETDSSAQGLIRQLLEQIEQLKSQIATLSSEVESIKEVKQEIKQISEEARETLRLLRQLQEGMSGEDVRLLQQILATDSDVYPEGLVTGYFGPLTRNAVRRFQKIAGIDQVGRVGPQTMAKINELLEKGAGSSGQVPPGLLIAPGIRKKVNLEILKPLPGQKLPPGIAKRITQEETEEDVAPLVISEIQISEITTTSAKISWVTNKEADSKVWYGATAPLVITDDTLQASSDDLVLNHQVLLSDLEPETSYYFVVSSTDEAENNEISEEKSFSTLSEN